MVTRQCISRPFSTSTRVSQGRVVTNVVSELCMAQNQGGSKTERLEQSTEPIFSRLKRKS